MWVIEKMMDLVSLNNFSFQEKHQQCSVYSDPNPASQCCRGHQDGL